MVFLFNGFYFFVHILVAKLSRRKVMMTFYGRRVYICVIPIPYYTVLPYFKIISAVQNYRVLTLFVLLHDN